MGHMAFSVFRLFLPLAERFGSDFSRGAAPGSKILGTGKTHVFRLYRRQALVVRNSGFRHPSSYSADDRCYCRGL